MLYEISDGSIKENNKGSSLRGYTMDTKNSESLPRVFLLFYQRSQEKIYFTESNEMGAFRIKLPTAALHSGQISYSAEKHGYVSGSDFAVLGKGVSPEFALKTIGLVPWSEKIDENLPPFDPDAIQTPLNIPLNLRIGEQGKSNIEILWDDVENSVGYEVSWSTDKNFTTTKTARMSRRVKNPQKSSISRLKANTRYFIRLKALAKRGRSAYQDGPYSKPIEAKTDRATLNAPPNITLKIEGGDKIQLTWDAVDNSSGYKILWSKSADMSSAGSTEVSARESHTISGLDALTQYYFTLVSLGRGDYRNSEPSQVVKATTGKTSISSPANLAIVRKSSKTVELRWRTVNRSRGYEVSWGTSNAADARTATASSTTHTISGLNTTTKYYIKVKALVDSASQTAFQDSPYSPVMEVTTQTLLAVPGEITFDNITGLSMQTSWKAVANASGYEISWGTSSAATGGTGSPATVNSGSSYTISGLNPQTTYYVKIKALGSAEYEASAYSTVQNITTTKIILATPFMESMVSSQWDRITIEWPKVANATGYDLSWGSTANAMGTSKTITPGSGTKESVVISPLAANRTYYFKLRAKGSGNYENSPWTNARSARTLKKPLTSTGKHKHNQHDRCKHNANVESRSQCYQLPPWPERSEPERYDSWH